MTDLRLANSWSARLAAWLLAISLLLTTVALPLATAHAITPLTAGRSIFHIIRAMVQRGRIYGDLERARSEVNEELAQMRIVALQHSRRVGNIGDQEAIHQQSQFLQAELYRIRQTEDAITEVTENLKKMTRSRFNSKLGETALNVMLQQVSSTSGFQKINAGVTRAFTGTGDAFDRVIGAIDGGGGEVLNRISDVRAELQRAAALAGLVGGRKGAEIGSRLSRLDDRLGSLTGNFDEIRDEVLGELREGRETVENIQGEYEAAIAGISDWQPSDFGLDRGRTNAAQRAGIDVALTNLQDERVSPVVRELAAAGAQQAHSRIGGIASALGITDEARINEIAILVGAAILQEYQDGNGATLDVDALIANVVAGMVADEEGEEGDEDEPDSGEITDVEPVLADVRAPEIWVGDMPDFVAALITEEDGSVIAVLSNEIRLGLPGEDGGPVNGSFLLIVDATGLNAPRKAEPRTEICTIRVSLWGTFEGVVEEGERPLELSGSAIYNGRFENIDCTLGFEFDLTGEYLGYEVGWHAEWTDFGYMGAIESDEDGDDLIFVADELLEP
jgi:hypothetical protein